MTVGGLSLSGNADKDETYTSTGALATKASGSNISLSNFGTVTFQDDVTSAGGLSISNVNSVVLDTNTKGGNITLTASSGDIAINTSIAAITASDNNNGHDVIFVTSGGTGDISLFGFDGDDGANGTNADLTFNAGGSSGVVSVGAISDTGTVTVTQSGGTTFSGNIAVANLTITDTADAASVTFADGQDVDITAGFIVSNAGSDAYNVVINSRLLMQLETRTSSNEGTLTWVTDRILLPCRRIVN